MDVTIIDPLRVTSLYSIFFGTSIRQSLWSESMSLFPDFAGVGGESGTRNLVVERMKLISMEAGRLLSFHQALLMAWSNLVSPAYQ